MSKLNAFIGNLKNMKIFKMGIEEGKRGAFKEIRNKLIVLNGIKALNWLNKKIKECDDS